MATTDMDNVVVHIVGECTDHLPHKQNIGSDTLIADLLVDSLRMVQIVFELETTFGVELPEHALFQIDTVGDLIDLVRLVTHPGMAGTPGRRISPSPPGSWLNPRQ